MINNQLECYSDNIRIVLVHTSHPGNIGAAARAMKTMNLQHLVLVSPKIYPHADATARSAGADDILHNCEIVDTLEEAIADCHLVIGTSARMRSLPWPQLTPRECGDKATLQAATGQVAIVFGREKSGLSNEELQLCHYHVHIPCNPDYQSLNLAAAVQVIAYEINVSLQSNDLPDQDDTQTSLVTAKEMQLFFEHLEQVLLAIEFLDPKQPKQLLKRLHRLFNRAMLEREEMHILRGILTAIERQ